MEFLRRVERSILALGMLLMALAFVANVVARMLSPALATRLVWIETAALFCLAWVVFLGLGLTLERGRHIAMTSWLDSMDGRQARAVRRAIDATGLLFSLVLCRYSLDLALFVWRSGQTSPTLDISMAWLYAPMPLGFLLLALRYGLSLFGRAGDARAADGTAGA